MSKISRNNNNQDLPWQFSVLSYIIYGILFLIPLYFNQAHWAAFVPPKVFLFESLVLIMLPFFVWGMFQTKKPFHLSWIHILVLIILIVLTISSLRGENMATSLWSTFSRSTGLFFLYICTLFAFILGELISLKKSILPSFLLASFVSAVLVALISYFGPEGFGRSTQFFDNTQGGSTIGNTSLAGAYLLFNICFGIFLFFKSNNKIQRLLFVAGGLIMIFSPILFNLSAFASGIFSALKNPISLIGQARGATIGIGMSFLTVIILFLIIQDSKKWLKKIGIFLGITLFVLVGYGLVLITKDGSTVHQKIVEYAGPNRFVFWDIAKEELQERPVLGSGVSQYENIYQRRFNPIVLSPGYARELWVNRPHNIFLGLLISGGWTAFVLVALLFIVSLFYLFKSIKQEESKDKKILAITICSALFGYALQGLFVLNDPLIFLMLFLILSIFIGIASEYTLLFKLRGNEEMPRKEIAKSVQVSIIFILFFTSFFLQEKFVWSASRESKAILTMIDKSAIQERAILRPKIYKISSVGSIDDISYLANRFYESYKGYFSKITDESRPILVNEIKSLIGEMEIILQTQPNHYRTNLMLANLSNLYNQIMSPTIDSLYGKKAQKYGKKAQEIAPQNPYPLLEIAKSFILEKRYQEADILLEKSFILTPYNSSTHTYLIWLARVQGNMQLANERYQRAKKYLPGFEYKEDL